jgi:aryl-alcohol dehydrogenase-like predicted oxidoreductase
MTARVLGRSGITTSRLGLGASYGVGERDVERAIERGVTYLYWGSMRRDGFGRAIARAAKRDRERLCVVVQSYSRVAIALDASLELGLRRLGIEYADVLLLGWWNQVPPERILDAAACLVEAGKVRHVMISCHHRPSFEKLIALPQVGAIMVRYNAAHRGAEREVFPHLAASPPGVVAYTATRWGALLDPAMVPEGVPRPRASDCYRFCLTNPSVTMCLAGPKNRAELDEAMAALDRGPLDAGELAWMKQVGDAVHTAAGLKAARSPAQMLDRIAERVYPWISGSR